MLLVGAALLAVWIFDDWFFVNTTKKQPR